MTPISILAQSPTRGTGSQTQARFPGQEMDGQWSWGATPSTVFIRYVGQAPVSVGAELEITAGPYTLWGLCKSDAQTDRADGSVRTLQFVDFREYLGWDQVFGFFNEVDVRIVNGRRLRRWKHMLPADYPIQKVTFTSDPYTAAEILELVLQAPTVGSPWAAGGTVYHPDQDGPVFNIDCNGKTLAAVLQEVCDRQGMVYGLMGGPYRLVFARKGEGFLPPFPFEAQRRLGFALSGNPSRIRLEGDRNLYQVNNVNLVPDWAAAWEDYADFESLVEEVYWSMPEPVTNAAFHNLANDPEHFIGWQLAEQRALTITVREWANFKNGLRAGDGDPFLDNRRYAGRSRLDLPVALYLRMLLYRAYRPDLPQGLTNIYGNTVPWGANGESALEIAERLLAAVTHDPITGVIRIDPGLPPDPSGFLPGDGNGYVIVKGFLVGGEMFRTLRPEAMPPNLFATANAVWTPVPFAVDDSGEGYAFVILDQPAITSPDMFVRQNGLWVQNANFTLASAAVKGALTFRAERYEYLLGVPGKDAVENVSMLGGEFVGDTPSSAWKEVPYADGETVDVKALPIAQALLKRQWAYVEGGWETPDPTGIGLTPTVDRVSLRLGPHGGSETVDFTNERLRDYFEPSRELDRQTVQNAYFPGQVELRAEARQRAVLAAGLRANPDLYHDLWRLLGGALGKDRVVLQKVNFKNQQQPN